MTSADAQLQQQLKEAGKQLSNPPASVEDLLPILDEVEKLLSKVDQSPRKPMIDALKPSMRALMKDALLKHEDVDVKVAVAACISEITRITAPDAPYEDDVMRDVFQLIVFSFENLFDESSRSYNKRASILETVSKVRSCVIMLDLECDELIVEMFEHFLNSVRDYHPDSIFSSMENIMVLVLEESEEIPVEMLKPLLAIVKKDNTGVLPVARKLVEGVFLKSAEKLQPCLKLALKSLGESLDKYTQVVTSVCERPTTTSENNDENTSGLQSAKEIKLEKGSVDETPQADESKLTTASSEHSDQVVKEEASREEEVDRTGDKSPKSVTSNGVSEAGNEEPSVDQESKKPKEEISQQPVNKEDSDDDSNTDKLAKTKSPTEQTFKSEETKADTVVNSAEPSDSSHVEGEKEIEKDNDVKESENEKDDDEDDDGVKQSEIEEVKDDVKESETAKDNDNDNDDKESESEAVIPPETEKDSDDKKPAETANASSPSESHSLSEDKPIRSKKKPVPQEDETASPSNGRSKNKGLTREEPPEEQKAGKKTVIAKESKLPDTVNESEEDSEEVGEPSSDSDAKPLKKSATKPRSKLYTKAGKQSGKKSKQAGKKMDVKQTGKKLDVGEESDDSDAKPLKTSVKKGQKSKTIVDDDSDSDAKPLKTSVKKGEKSKATVDDDEDSDSDAKPLKTSVKKGEKSKNTVDDDEDSDSDAKPLKTSVKKGSSLKKKDTGKKRGNGKNPVEKDQAKSLSEDDEMDISPKVLSKSAKGEGNSKETSVTSAKRKRTAGKDNKSDAIKYDESLIGTKVKVWWPEDKMYYEGVVAEFYPAKKKHKVSYVDGDEEVLILKTQKWEILQEFSRRDDKEQTTEAQSEEEASPEIHKKKKSKADTAPSRSQEKGKDSAKRVGGASSSGKSKKENSGAKSTKKTSGKSSDAAADSEDEETPKAGAKTINKSKGKTPQSGGKTNTNGPTKGKSGSSNVKTPESGKGKSTETAKGGSKSGNKRKKRG